MLTFALRSSVMKCLSLGLAVAAVSVATGCGKGTQRTTNAGPGSSISVPLVPQSERPQRLSFPLQIALEDVNGRRVANIPIRYDFSEAEIILLGGPSASERIALQALQSATVSSELSNANSGVVSVDRQARSSLLPLYNGEADLALNSLRYQVSGAAFGVSDDLRLNVQSFYGANRLIIGIWVEMYTADGDWAGFHPAYDSWISVPLADIGSARLDEIAINIPELHQEVRQVLRDKAAGRETGGVDLQNIVSPNQRGQEDATE